MLPRRFFGTRPSYPDARMTACGPIKRGMAALQRPFHVHWCECRSRHPAVILVQRHALHLGALRAADANRINTLRLSAQVDGAIAVRAAGEHGLAEHVNDLDRISIEDL